jgi:hypothetical protein
MVDRLIRHHAITIHTALTDPHLLGSALGDPHSWQTWLAVLKSAFGLPLHDRRTCILPFSCRRSSSTNNPRARAMGNNWTAWR